MTNQPRPGTKQAAYYAMLKKITVGNPALILRENVANLQSFRANVKACAESYGLGEFTISCKRGDEVITVRLYSDDTTTSDKLF